MSNSLVEKYRPKTLDELIGNPEITSILKNTPKLPNLLFYGPPGTGKTSAAKILSKNYATLELNASDDRGIDIVRTRVKEFCSVSGSRDRLVILDEVDAMSRDAQNALRRIIEDTGVRFILIGNYVNKIIPPIQSRCTRFRFSPVGSVEMRRRIEFVCDMENIRVVSGLDELVEMAGGDMRAALNDLEGVYRGFGVVTRENVYKFTGAVKLEFTMHSNEKTCTNDEKDPILNFKTVSDTLDALKGQIDGISICRELGERIRRSRLKNKLDKLKILAEIEYNLSLGCSEELQINGIKAIFKD